jgi:hypothetical protein
MPKCDEMLLFFVGNRKYKMKKRMNSSFGLKKRKNDRFYHHLCERCGSVTKRRAWIHHEIQWPIDRIAADARTNFKPSWRDAGSDPSEDAPSVSESPP